MPKFKPGEFIQSKTRPGTYKPLLNMQIVSITIDKKFYYIRAFSTVAKRYIKFKAGIKSIDEAYYKV